MVMMNQPIKRSRDAEYNTINTIAKCLMLLSNTSGFEPGFETTTNRVFECKTCKRQFPSFQALGGHRASHKKPKLGGEDLSLHQSQMQIMSPAKPKSHECSICGLEFALGQALGGHMRRHRAAIMNENTQPLPGHGSLGSAPVDPVVKKSKSGKRVWSLDLNLTPMENDLEFRLGKIDTAVDCIL